MNILVKNVYKIKSYAKEFYLNCLKAILLFHFIDLFTQLPFKKSTVYFWKSTVAESINNSFKNQKW